MAELIESNNKRLNSFIYDQQTKNLHSRLLRYMKAGYPVHLTGPTGTGKTSLALSLAKKRRRPVMLMHGNHELDNEDLIGGFTGYKSEKVIDHFVRSVYKKDESVSEEWKDGRLLEAVKHGYTLIYDEFTRSKATTNNIFLSILEEGVLPMYGSKQTEPFHKVHPEFSIIFTSNPEEYAGVYKTQDALLDRLITIFVENKTTKQEASILTHKLGLNDRDANTITTLIGRLRKYSSGEHSAPTLRSSLMIAKIAIEEDIEIDGDDLEFQQLCVDVLRAPVSRLLESDHPITTAKELIIQECKNIGN